jgi:hypothetical protein
VAERYDAPMPEPRSYSAPSRGYDAGRAEPAPSYSAPEPRYSASEPRSEPRFESRAFDRSDSGHSGSRGEGGGVRRVGSNRDD